MKKTMPSHVMVPELVYDANASSFCRSRPSILTRTPSLKIHSHNIDVLLRLLLFARALASAFPIHPSIHPPLCPPHEITLSTQPFSSLLTCSLKASTSLQQSSGRRSLERRHRTTSLRAASTLSGTSRTNLLVSSFRRRSSISLDTSCREVGSSSGMDSEASLAVSLERFALLSASSLRSSAATRAWTWASASCAREVSVYLG